MKDGLYSGQKLMNECDEDKEIARSAQRVVTAWTTIKHQWAVDQWAAEMLGRSREVSNPLIAVSRPSPGPIDPRADQVET